LIDESTYARRNAIALQEKCVQLSQSWSGADHVFTSTTKRTHSALLPAVVMQQSNDPENQASEMKSIFQHVFEQMQDIRNNAAQCAVKRNVTYM